MHARLRSSVLSLSLTFCALSGLACEPEAEAPSVSPDEEPTLAQAAREPEATPHHAVGTVRIELTIEPGRTLPVQLWYPAEESAREEAERGRPLPEIEPPGPRRETLVKLLEAAPAPCTSHTFHAADAPAAIAQGGPLPLLMFSHCMSCIRWSSLTLAEHLASLGFVVAAPDHMGDTVFERIEHRAVGFSDLRFIQRRATDIERVLDLLLDPRANVLPDTLRGRLDPERVGMYGHSYGSWTTQVVLGRNLRVRAGAMLALPSFSLEGTSRIRAPGFYVEAAEDNMITGIGNALLRASYQQYGGRAWLMTLKDAGHYSFTDIVGIDGTPYFAAGCGRAMRQTNPLRAFTYLDIERARDITKRYLGAFFRKELLGQGEGPAALPKPAEVTLQSKAARATR